MKMFPGMFALCFALFAATSHAGGRVSKPAGGDGARADSVSASSKRPPKALSRQRRPGSAAPATKWVNWKTNPFLHLPGGGLAEGQLAIGVYGGAGADVKPAHLALAARVGRAIAKQGHVTMTGAAPGFPDAAIKGALQEGGLTVGFSPHDTKARHLAFGSPTNVHVMQKTPQHPFTKQLRGGKYAPEYTAREIALVHAAHGGIFLAGRFGTLEELAMSLENQDVIGVLTGLGGISSQTKRLVAASTKAGKAPAVEIIYDANPERLVARVIAATAAWQKLRTPGPLGEPAGAAKHK